MFTELVEYVGSGLNPVMSTEGYEMFVLPELVDGFHRLMAIKDPTAYHE